MNTPRVYADFHNTDLQGRVRLNCVGSTEDISRQQIKLREGLTLTLYCDDLDDDGNPDELVAEGAAAFSEEEQCWVVAIDWSAIQHASEIKRARSNPASR